MKAYLRELRYRFVTWINWECRWCHARGTEYCRDWCPNSYLRALPPEGVIMMTIYSRGRPTSGALVPVPGLINIPVELRSEARVLVEQLNREAGWEKYQAL